MKNQTRMLFREPQPNGTTLIGELFYEKGGTTLGTMLGYSNGPEPRGYYLRVRRTINQHGSQCFILGDGVKQFVQSATRFSEKQLHTLMINPGLITDLKAKTLQKHIPQHLLTPSS